MRVCYLFRACTDITTHCGAYFGNLFTNMSLRKVAVSFTHTIKAAELFFSVILGEAIMLLFSFPFNLPLLIVISCSSKFDDS